ncbi:Plant self-incompatibility protein S1 family [Euphorbia peplus]|nr:Plant self-incompatibility protein S1 family [Euphorbia peplus]
MISPWSGTILTFLFFLTAYNHPIVEASNKITVAKQTKIKIEVCLKFTVHVINALSSNEHPLNIHCQSRDDDLGSHTLYVGGDFHFKFGTKLVGKKSWFTCDMIWGSKHQHVDVFKQNYEGDLCCPTRTCYWKAKNNGIYFNNIDDPTFNLKRYDWLE